VSLLPYSLVIPTFELPDELDRTFAGIAAQTRQPHTVVVVDSSGDDRTRALTAAWQDRLPLRYLHTTSAVPRFSGMKEPALLDAAESPLVGFMDDDIGLTQTPARSSAASSIATRKAASAAWPCASTKSAARSRLAGRGGIIACRRLRGSHYGGKLFGRRSIASPATPKARPSSSARNG
jgi:hypothetical protein